MEKVGTKNYKCSDYIQERRITGTQGRRGRFWGIRYKKTLKSNQIGFLVYFIITAFTLRDKRRNKVMCRFILGEYLNLTGYSQGQYVCVMYKIYKGKDRSRESR